MSTGRGLLGLLFRLVFLLAAWGSAIILPVAIAVRLSVRDHFPISGFIFYATPWLVLCAMSTTCFLYWRSTRLSRWFCGISLLCLGMWAWTSFRIQPEKSVSHSFRISYWNVGRPESRLPGVLAEASQWHADFLVFGEHKQFKTSPAWAEHFTDRTITPLPRGLLLASPSPVKRMDGGSLGGVGGCQICLVKIKNRTAYLLMVDFDSHPLVSREAAFKRLREIIAAYSGHPLIVIGDFNTPSDSVHFKNMRNLLTSAFDSAGHGYAATWPTPLPVMQLDHIWFNEHLRCTRCEHITSLYSDHRAVVADFEFAP